MRTNCKVELREDAEVINIIYQGTKFFPIDNFYPNAPCEYEGLLYLNSEAAFQSAKLSDRKLRIPFTTMSPAKSKYVGKTPHLTPLRKDWDKVRDQVMYDVVKSKMMMNTDIREMLDQTGDAEIIEGTWWNDRIWGIDLNTGIGQNKLGKILMRLRREFRDGAIEV